jgi:GAF domain-containing protein
LKRRNGSRKLAQRRRAPGPKSGAPRATRASTANTVAALTSELKEAREQQEATSEVLKIISSSPGALDPVFHAMLENATRICEASFGNFFMCDGPLLTGVAIHGNDDYVNYWRRNPVLDLREHPGVPLDRIRHRKQIVHIADLRADPSYRAKDGRMVNLVETAGARTYLTVPLLKEGELAGVIALYRQEVRPFTDKQIELVKNFAAQAVIAIENTRLLNELRESLEQQTASSEVLKVISKSPGELTPVFQAMLENATRLCEAHFGAIVRFDGKLFHFIAELNTPPKLSEFLRERGSFTPQPGSVLEQVIQTKAVAQIEDDAARSTPGAPAKFGGARSTLGVPMLKDNKLVGALVIYRTEVRPFTDKQMKLVSNFAAQAVIAIDNARLLNELRETLERQTATSEVLKIINSSAGELKPVFETILENATRICEAKFGILYRYENNLFYPAAQLNTSPELNDFIRQRGSFAPKAESPLGRLLHEKAVTYADAPVPGTASGLGGAQSLIAVPMLKDGELIGAIVIYRQEVRPFSDSQIDLVTNFAAQAVIAIENTRLLNDLNAVNQQLEQRVADQVGEIERMGRLRRFLPPQVADLIVASGNEKQLESHRREITALFCDLRGFTGFSESSDPEDVMTLLRDYHAAIGEIIIKYSGTLERYAGDGVMVIFNDPVPVPNPALQAVKMALDMRVAIGALIEKWRRLGHDLGFGIGIAHGFATLGTIGFEGRFDYAAIGTVSNVASRLCDEAKPGQILISPRVLLAVEDAVRVEAVGDFELKGIRRPMAAYNVLAMKTAN